MEFIKAHIKEFKLAAITFIVTLAICLGGFFLINKNNGNSQNSTVSQNTSITYVGSKNSDKYHLPTCKWAQKIKLKQKDILLAKLAYDSHKTKQLLT